MKITTKFMKEIKKVTTNTYDFDDIKPIMYFVIQGKDYWSQYEIVKGIFDFADEFPSSTTINFYYKIGNGSIYIQKNRHKNTDDWRKGFDRDCFETFELAKLFLIQEQKVEIKIQENKIASNWRRIEIIQEMKEGE